MSQKKKRLLAAAGAVLFAVLMVLFGRYAKELFSDADRFAAWLRGMGIAGEGIMVLLVIVQVLLAVVPGGPFQIVTVFDHTAFPDGKGRFVHNGRFQGIMNLPVHVDAG